MVEIVDEFDVGQACHAAPEDFRTRRAIARASQVATQPAQEAHCFVEARGQIRRGFGFVHEGGQGAPLGGGEVNGAGDLRRFPAERGDRDKMFSAINWKGKTNDLLAVLVVDGEWTGETLRVMANVFDYVVPIGRVDELVQSIEAYLKGDRRKLKWLIEFRISPA